MSPNRKLLFVVNSGSNTVTSFAVTADGITRADTKKSGGVLPISLAVHGKLLYVLNGVSGNIRGYTFDTAGKLTPIPNSKRSLSVSGPNGVAADIGFSPAGNWLVVSMRYLPLTTGTHGQPGLIDTFPVHANGSVGSAVQTTAATPTAFGFRFLPSGILVADSAGLVDSKNNTPPPLADGSQINGSVETYRIRSDGTLTAISNAASGGRATCWVALSKDHRYAFATNTLSATAAHPAPGKPIGSGLAGLSRYSIAADGALTLLGTVNTGPGTPGDVAVSPDGKYLYMDDPSAGALPIKSHLEVYRIGAGGRLTRVQTTPKTLSIGVSGLAIT